MSGQQYQWLLGLRFPDAKTSPIVVLAFFLFMENWRQDPPPPFPVSIVAIHLKSVMRGGGNAFLGKAVKSGTKTDVCSYPPCEYMISRLPI